MAHLRRASSSTPLGYKHVAPLEPRRMSQVCDYCFNGLSKKSSLAFDPRPGVNEKLNFARVSKACRTQIEHETLPPM